MTVTHAIDPVTFEIIRHKLYQVTDEAIIALENVSGSPVTNEGHDMMASLYKANGDLMIGGVGFLHHLTSAAQAVKHILAEFGEDPGIFEDDVYFFNDPYTAALHPPDVYMISPIHHEGTLTGFVANFVHVTDIGAVDPGGFSPNARDNFQEGFQTKGMKLVERGRIRKDILGTFLNMVRDPGMTQLDLKSQLAANHVAKERMAKLYGQYGMDTVEIVADELISQSERLMRERLAELPDGEWRVREYVDTAGAECVVNLTLTKQHDRLIYDFTGSSDQVDLGLNCSYWATWGGLFAPIFPLLAWDITWNVGVTRPVELIAPAGSVTNCTRPAPISIATVGVIQVVNNLSTLAISKMFGASDKHWRRATAVWHGSHAHVETHGRGDDGGEFVAPLTDTFCGAGGARAFRDGVDLGGEIPNVVSRWANAETQELNTPLVYLFRRVVPDSGGPGKYRGGVSHEYAFARSGSSEHGLGVVVFGKGTEAPLSLGIFGGLPGCTVGYRTLRAEREEELLDAPDVSARDGEATSWGMLDLEGQDVQYIRFSGGGGYGDPLERDPQAVIEDVRGGLVSTEAARDVYGVVLQGSQLDEKGTEEQRLGLRAGRIGRPVESSLATRQQVPSTGQRISEYLQRAKDGGTQCTWCGLLVAPADQDWKDQAVLRRTDLARVGGGQGDGAQYVLIEACCPQCATLLDTEVARGDDEPLHDHVRSWPAPGPEGNIDEPRPDLEDGRKCRS